MDALDELLHEKYPPSDSLMMEMQPKASAYTGQQISLNLWTDKEYD
jgi:hypothetical protein